MTRCIGHCKCFHSCKNDNIRKSSALDFLVLAFNKVAVKKIAWFVSSVEISLSSENISSLLQSFLAVQTTGHFFSFRKKNFLLPPLVAFLFAARFTTSIVIQADSCEERQTKHVQICFLDACLARSTIVCTCLILWIIFTCHKFKNKENTHTCVVPCFSSSKNDPRCHQPASIDSLSSFLWCWCISFWFCHGDTIFWSSFKLCLNDVLATKLMWQLAKLLSCS